MSELPNPLNNQRLTRASIIGVGLAIGGIVLFLVLWLLLEGIDRVPRMVISVCLPPTLITFAVGVYFLVSQPQNKD